jgi:hypothetical protein
MNAASIGLESASGLAPRAGAASGSALPTDFPQSPDARAT